MILKVWIVKDLIKIFARGLLMNQSWGMGEKGVGS